MRWRATLTFDGRTRDQVIEEQELGTYALGCLWMAALQERGPVTLTVEPLPEPA